MKYGFVYIWYDHKWKRYYIGCHWGSIDDGYICSSKWMKDSYKRRPQDFKRRILVTNIHSKKELLNEEYRFLSKIKNDEIGKRYYNLHNHHFEHWSTSDNTLNVKEKIRVARSNQIFTDEQLEKRRQSLKEFYRTEKGIEVKKQRALNNTGKKRTEKTKKKMSEWQIGQIRNPLSKETKQKLHDSLLGNKNPFYGKTHSDEVKEKMKLKFTGKTRKRDETGKWYWSEKIT